VGEPSTDVEVEGGKPVWVENDVDVWFEAEDPIIKARLAGLGVNPMSMTSAAFGKFIADETEQWGNVIQALNIKAE
jgi:tripartite-type tricarboxylate transporter receptor subunit TctC